LFGPLTSGPSFWHLGMCLPGLPLIPQIPKIVAFRPPGAASWRRWRCHLWDETCGKSWFIESMYLVMGCINDSVHDSKDLGVRLLDFLRRSVMNPFNVWWIAMILIHFYIISHLRMDHGMALLESTVAQRPPSPTRCQRGEGPRAMAARASGDVRGCHWQVIGEMCGKLLRDAKGLFVLSLF
jgi:hypothetical protein